jgi:ubiquinone/menaquinone biosynthesis C-methylase UbiE
MRMRKPTRNHALEAVRSYYHKILPFYEEENEERPDLDFWRTLVAERKPRSVLELGAGSGRVTAALAGQAPIVALDLSDEMLQRAAQRLRKQSASSIVSLVNADMRQFAFACRFDLAIAPNDPFSHLTQRRERQLALRTIAHHLGPAGCLVIEGLYRPERKRLDMPEHTAGNVSIRESWQPFGRDNRWRARYSYQSGERHVDAEFVARSWDLEEARTLLNAYGLELKQIWGDFDRHPFTPDAGRMILLAVKRPKVERARNSLVPVSDVL